MSNAASALKIVAACAAGIALSACPVDDRAVTAPGAGDATEIVPGQSSSGGEGGAAGGGAPRLPNQLDLLFMIDNSISMSDKQETLRAAVPDLVSRLLNPRCVDAQGNASAPPVEGSALCPGGQRQEFSPIEDLHVGIVSSSLGDVGANVACPAVLSLPRYRPDRVDMAHLIGSLERSSAQTNEQGFLEWRAGASDVVAFGQGLQQLVSDVGERGCGWEASLESWYRFLVDPRPYAEIVRVLCPDSMSTAANCAQPATQADGTLLLDETLLAQRAAFLRPDSLVAIVLLSDENDCSMQVNDSVSQGQSWVPLAVDDARPMFRGSSICATDPNAKCCYSCPLEPPEGCQPDPACSADAANLNRLAPEQDGANLRCYDQKRRFGVDFLYPTQRYVHALTQAQLCLEHADLATAGCPGALVANPLFLGSRTPADVLLAGIVGVPWQALASPVDAAGRPLADPARQLRFKSSEELTEADWLRIAGSPGTPWRAAASNSPEVASTPPRLPTEPSMVESPLPRPGVAPGNPINGREYDTTSNTRPDDLQFACIFPLPAPRDCSQRDPAAGDACDCYQGAFDQPLCEVTPGDGLPGTTQLWAKAYPGLRHLEVLRGLGENAVVASICARNTTDTGRPDYGYRPAMDAILERLQKRLSGR